jgi:hypothetical protein
MSHYLPVCQPGVIVPGAVRDAAARVGGRRSPLDLRVLERVRDALSRLPDHPLHRTTSRSRRRLAVSSR